MGPLSAKQHREYLKFAAQEARETSKMEREESRKQELHELKLMEAAGKANQSLGHKEQVHEYKMGTMSAPLSKVKKPNPLAGAGLFSRGQHMLPYQVEDAAKARKAAKQTTDTIPAMLTPGEAVIPEPAAQDPKNKPIIKQMVQEGRKANRRKQRGYRDGSVNIVNSDVIPTRVQQAAGYNEGTIQVPVPSLAYEHSDVPGSSFEDGTERVYDFKRGSSADYHFEDGIEEVPNPIQAAVEANKLRIAEEVPAPAVIPVEQPASVASNATPVAPELQVDPIQNAVKENNARVISERTIEAVPVVDPINTNVVNAITTNTPQVPQAQNRFQALEPVPATAVAVGGNESTVNIDVPKPVTEGIVAPDIVPKPVLKAEDDDTKPEYWIKHLRGTQGDVDKAIAGKTDEDAIKSLKDVFTLKGFKSILGLNDQELMRLAVTTIGGRAMGYDTAKSLSYAGKQAFDSSLKRQAQEAQDKRQDKQLKAQQQRDDTRFAITMASQSKAEKKAEADRELTTRRLDLAERKAEAVELARDADRKFQQLKEDNKWTIEQNRAVQSRHQHLQDKFQTHLAMDVPSNVRKSALDMVYKSKTPEDWLSNMESATILLAANTRHKDPNAGANSYKPHWSTYVMGNGDTIQASRRPDGNLDVVTPKGVVVAPPNYAVNYGEKKDNENSVRAIVENRAKGIKGLTEGQVSKMKEDAVLMSQQFQHINPTQFASALEKTFSNLKEQGEGLSSGAFQKAFTTTAIVELNPSSSHLYSGTDKEGKLGYLSDKAQIDMGDAYQKLSKQKGSLDKADLDTKQKWNSLSQEQRETMHRIGSNGKGQDVGTRREGYSAYSEFVIEMAKPPEQRKYKWLQSIK